MTKQTRTSIRGKGFVITSNDPAKAAEVKAEIAIKYDLPDAEHVNITKVQAYLTHLKTPQARLEAFLDGHSLSLAEWDNTGGQTDEPSRPRVRRWIGA